MKNTILIIAISLMVSTTLQAQTVLFKDLSNEQSIRSESAHYIKKSVNAPAKDLKFIKFDFYQFSRSDIGQEYILSKTFPFELKLLEKKLEGDRIKLKYRVGQNGTLLLSLLDGDVIGYLFDGAEQYLIKSLGQNQVIYKYNIEYNTGKCGVEPVLRTESNRIPIDHGGERGDETESGSGGGELDQNPECNLRLLVLYTPAAKYLVPNIQNTIGLSIDVTNFSFDNSLIYQQVEIAFYDEINYTESGNIYTDLHRFWESGDGIMEDVHPLRNVFAADMCVLMTDENETSSGILGVAKAVYADQEHAFCVVDAGYAVDNLTFPHEIGHLLGSWHDNQIQNFLPFERGHGHTLPNNFRTIMGHNQQNVLRIPYWSNPNVNYLGIPTGMIGLSNNAMVLNTTIKDARTFRNYFPLYSFPFTYVFNYDDFYDNLGNALLNEASTGCTGNPNAGGLENEGYVKNTGDTWGGEDVLNHSINIIPYPNPSQGKFTLVGPIQNIIAYQIVNILGEEVIQKQTYHHQVIDLSNQPNGIYLVKIFEQNQTHTIKLIKE